MRANLIPVGANAASDGHTPIIQFFYNVKILADEHTQQAVILFSMLFTLIIWVISALSLIISVLMYLVFLAHYIDGTLSSYCRRKIDKRLEKIVSVKIQKALQKQADARKKVEEKVQAVEKPSSLFSADPKTKAHNVTVKDLGYLDLPLSRRTTETSTTTTNHPAYRPTRQERLAQQQPSTDSIGESVRPGAPTRTATQTSQATSIDSDKRPLLHQAASMGSIPLTRTISNQSSQSGLIQGYQKPLPMPGAFDPFYSSDDNLAAHSNQTYSVPMDTFNNLPAFEFSARPESAQSHYTNYPSARPMSTRMPSIGDCTTGLEYNNSRQPSLTSHNMPGYSDSSYNHTIDPVTSLYSQATADMPNQPHHNDISRTYTPFGLQQQHQDPFASNVPLSRTPEPQPPARSATLPIAPRMPARALTPPRRVGTAPPSSVMRTSPSSIPYQPAMVYELDGGHAVGLDGEERPQSRFQMPRRRESDEELGREQPQGVENRKGTGMDGYGYP